MRRFLRPTLRRPFFFFLRAMSFSPTVSYSLRRFRILPDKKRFYSGPTLPRQAPELPEEPPIASALSLPARAVVFHKCQLTLTLCHASGLVGVPPAQQFRQPFPSRFRPTHRAKPGLFQGKTPCWLSAAQRIRATSCETGSASWLRGRKRRSRRWAGRTSYSMMPDAEDGCYVRRLDFSRLWDQAILTNFSRGAGRSDAPPSLRRRLAVGVPLLVKTLREERLEFHQPG